MAGRVIRLAPRSNYQFNSLGAAGETWISLAQHVDVSQYRDLTLMVRLHSINIAENSGGTLTVRALPDGHTQEDPAQFFLDTSSSTGLGEAQFNSNDIAPDFDAVALSSGAGALVTVVLIAKQDPSQVLDLEATISVDLSMKD